MQPKIVYIKSMPAATTHRIPDRIFLAGARTERHILVRDGVRRRPFHAPDVFARYPMIVRRPVAFAKDPHFALAIAPPLVSPKESDSHRVHSRSCPAQRHRKQPMRAVFGYSEDLVCRKVAISFNHDTARGGAAGIERQRVDGAQERYDSFRQVPGPRRFGGRAWRLR